MKAYYFYNSENDEENFGYHRKELNAVRY